jgi:hypothetical protein
MTLVFAKHGSSSPEAGFSSIITQLPGNRCGFEWPFFSGVLARNLVFDARVFYWTVIVPVIPASSSLKKGKVPGELKLK